MKIGDTMLVVPEFLSQGDGHDDERKVRGTVIYVHPRQRFCVLRFDFSKNSVREAFVIKTDTMERGKEYANDRDYERQGWRRKDSHHR